MSYTFATLKSELQAHMGDAGAAYLAELPNLIALGELRCLKDLDLTIFDTTVSSIVFTLGNALVDKPTGYLATDTLIYVTAGGTKVTLKRRTTDYLYDYNATAASGTPEFFSEYSDTQWMVAKIPAVGITNGISRYNKRPAGLADSSPTWLSTNVPDLLLMACLIASVEYTKNAEAMTAWTTEYTKQLASAHKEFAAQIRRKG